ncbi:Uncharacterised protein [Stenotrophomonas maltophilia]|nr:Uncharacterised protein [Stenotrophomonas maltophilia]
MGTQGGATGRRARAERSPRGGDRTGGGECRRCTGRRLDRRRAPGCSAATTAAARLRLGADHPWHPGQRHLLARQQFPGHGGTPRLQLLDSGDRCRRTELAVPLERTERRTEPPATAGACAEPSAQPVDGRPPDLPGDALGQPWRAGGRPPQARAVVRSQPRERPPLPLRRALRQRHRRRHRADRSCGAVPLRFPRGRRRQPAVRQCRCTRWPDSGRRHADAVRLYRHAQWPVQRRQPHVRGGPLRQALAQQWAPRHRSPDRLHQVRCGQRPAGDHAHRHLVDLGGAGAAQPGTGNRRGRHAGKRVRPCAGCMGRTPGPLRHRRCQRRPEDHAVFQPVPAVPVPEFRP